ncbi:MAG: hypothetical protein H9W81_13560 [Enterococcus sp.]|nr:hypothetical protein [Enterococcus sp.]
MENNNADMTAIINKHEALVTAVHGRHEIMVAVEPYALRFHDFLTRVMPLSPYAHKTHPLLSSDYGIIDFYDYELDLVDSTPNAFSYFEPHTACHFEVPYAYLTDPEKWEDEQRVEHRTKLDVVERVYEGFAPRVREEMPEMHPIITGITEKDGEEIALVNVVEGENYGITLNHPNRDVLVANVLTINLNTGEVITASLL